MVGHKRSEMFKFFKSIGGSFSALTIMERLRVGDFRDELRRSNVRTAHLLSYALARANWEIPEFRLREVDGEIVEIDKLYVSYTVHNPNTDVNHCSVLFDEQGSFADYVVEATRQEKIATSTQELLGSTPASDVYSGFNLSIIPWLHLSSITHDGFCFFPLFSIGKFTIEDSETISFNFAAKVHHGLVDALHIHRLHNSFIKNINEIREQAIVLT